MIIEAMSVYDAFEYVMNHYAPLNCDDDLLFRDKYAIISIQDAQSQGFGFVFNKSKYCKDVLTLYFDDIVEKTKGAVLFDESMADEIIKFLEENKNNIDNLIIHCYAGLSRSKAVAAFAKYYMGEDNSELLKYGLNKKVYETLIKRLKEKGVANEESN